jgi:hypothetical protein
MPESIQNQLAPASPPDADAFRQRVAAAILGAGSYRAEWRLLDAAASAGDEGPPLLEQTVVIRGPVHVSVPVGVEFWLVDGVQYRRGLDEDDIEVGPAPENGPRDLLFEFATETLWSADLATQAVVAGDPVGGEATWLLADAAEAHDAAEGIVDSALLVSQGTYLPLRLDASLGGGNVLRVRFFDFGGVGALDLPPELALLGA